jgi:hypothetical protein
VHHGRGAKRGGSDKPCDLSAAETHRLLGTLDEPVERRHWRLQWSAWRRQHQARANACHQARRERLYGLPAATSPAPAQRQMVPTPTEEQWQAILVLVAEAEATAHHKPLPAQPILEGIVWMMQRGERWEDIPARFGPWKTIATRYARWRKRGIWTAILAVLFPPPDPDPAPT